MNFKRFNGSTWDAIHHKTYDTLTESLERTANLADARAVTNELLFEDGRVNSNSNYRLTPFFENSSGLCISIEALKPDADRIRVGIYDQNQVFVERRMYTRNLLPIVIAPSDAAYIRVNWAVKSYATETIMINAGSTALPFVPYGFKLQASGDPLTDYTIYGNTVQDGTPTPEAPVDVVGCGVWDATAQQYKLPITCGGVTSNIYLGTQQSTRRIKKLVLTGGEVITKAASNPVFTMQLGGVYTPLSENAITTLSTHYQAQSNVSGTNNVNDMCVCIRRGYSTMYIGDTRYNNETDFKAYLAAQYAAGTPVTIWYVLAEPETGIVNEPLMKIGDYADTVSYAQAGVTIPTSGGDNTITFGTTVQPSGMSATFKGWHPVQGAKVYDGNDWR